MVATAEIKAGPGEQRILDGLRERGLLARHAPVSADVDEGKTALLRFFPTTAKTRSHTPALWKRDSRDTMCRRERKPADLMNLGLVESCLA